MEQLLRRVTWDLDGSPGIDGSPDEERLLMQEWIVTNGLGGYASGTVCGLPTRRYHGLLIAALPAPHGRTAMLAQATERCRLPSGRVIDLWGRTTTDDPLREFGAQYLREFCLEDGLPVWRYRFEDVVLEKRIVMPHEQNTVYVGYRLLEGPSPIRLKLMPFVHFRSHDADVATPVPLPYEAHASGDRFEFAPGGNGIPLRLAMYGDAPAFTFEGRVADDLRYRIEAERGYLSEGTGWSPGYFRADLEVGRDVALVASVEPWDTIEALDFEAALRTERERRQRLIARAHPACHEGIGAELVFAADQFLIRPATRTAEAARAHAEGDEARTVIAGYHWFTDWGRDTMISLEGLTLVTGRAEEAGSILRTFAHHVRDGLIPNYFPEGNNDGVYHTVDATLWFFHAIDRYVAATGDRETLRNLLPILLDIVEHHVRGTRFGIGVDSCDGLLTQGEEGYQLTWMDAKVGDWVVTPRRGKAVEINALWYNALRLLQGWCAEREDERSAAMLHAHAERARASFNTRFWCEQAGHLYDVVDGEVDGEPGDDPACRPNQVFAISLRHPILDRRYWWPVLETVRDRLLTPLGLRTLAPGHPHYKAAYFGNLQARDAAYHQGTVWAWLVGHFVDAWMKTQSEDGDTARAFLDGFRDHLSEAGIGTISEVFDAEAPYTPRGCIAQAWSVAEALRVWVATSSHVPRP
jgi:predicted glycogen debranching enzyme